MKSATVAAMAWSLASTAFAAVSKQCPTSNVCYQLSIPELTASSGKGDIFFQLSAPTSYQYVALGQGSSMPGANIFIMYTSSDGSNVTVSPRLGTGFVQPQHDPNAEITILEGSGVKNGMMTANVKCSSCNSWNGGSMDFTGSSASWIYSMKSGSPLNSDDLSENLDQHDTAASFEWDLSGAKGGSGINPLTGAAATPTAFAGSEIHDEDDDDDGDGSNHVLIAHGVLASLAFVALFPIGGILIRVASFTGLIWVHAAMQVLAFLIYVVAFAMGVSMATQMQMINHAHPIIGIALLVLLIGQPLFGFLHHKLFKKYGRRTAWSYVHIGIGRIAIPLGIINGGLGIQLAGGVSEGDIILYTIVASIMGLAYLGTAIMGEMRRKRGASPNFEGNQKGYQLRDVNSEEDVSIVR